MTPVTQTVPVERVYTYVRVIYRSYRFADEMREREREREASGVRRNARNWNDQLFDSHGTSLGANFLPCLSFSLLVISFSLF